MKLLLCLSFAMVYTTFSFSQGYVESQKFIANDRNINAFFGSASAYYNNELLIAAHGNDSIVSMGGAVYVFEKMGGQWQQKDMLFSNDITFNDQYGNALDVENNRLFVGSYRNDAGAIPAFGGAVYIYHNINDEWMLEQKVVSNDVNGIDFFGEALAASGNYLAIGAPRHDYDVNDENFVSEGGAVYIFKKDASNHWNQIEKLVPPFRGFEDRFGLSIGFLGNDLLVGAFRDDEDENESNFVDDAGAVYYYRNDGSDNFNLIQKISASDRGLNDANFGEKLLLKDNRLFIKGLTVNGLGGLYCFEKNVMEFWEENQIIENSVSSAATATGFAHSMDVSSNTLIVGSINESNASAIGGVVYFYQNINNVWSQTQMFYPSANVSSDLFGSSINIIEDEIIVGAQQQDFDALDLNEIANAGSVYSFVLDETLGITNANNINEITAYPNPTSGILNVYFSTQLPEIDITVTDVLGREHQTLKVQNTNAVELHLPEPNGLYFVTCITALQKSVIKIIKH